MMEFVLFQYYWNGWITRIMKEDLIIKNVVSITLNSLKPHNKSSQAQAAHGPNITII